MTENFPRKLLFTQVELAEVFQVTRQAIAKWNIKPVEENFYYLPDAVAYWKNIYGKKSKLSLEEERAKLAKVQTTKTRIEAQYKKIELDEKKRTVVTVKEVEKEWSDIVTTIKSKMLSLPHKLSAEVAENIFVKFGVRINEIEVEEISRKLVNDTLKDISLDG